MIGAVVIGSEEWGFQRGTIPKLDDTLRKLPKEAVARRCVAILNALAADRPDGFATVNRLLAQTLPEPEKSQLLLLLHKSKDSVFFEPLQQLVLLRRALAVCPADSGVAAESDQGVRLYVEASRLATDVIPSPDFDENAKKTEQWLNVASGMMTRMWITHPVHPTLWISRAIEIFEKLPESQPQLAAPAQRLKDALADGVGVPYSEATTLIRFLSLWSLRLKVDDVFRHPGAATFDPIQWREKLTIPANQIERFLDRRSRRLDDALDDALPGGMTGIIPFRDRPLLRFSDGTIAPIYPELLIEKLTPLMFWWSTTPAEQQRHWRTDWGLLAEAYASVVLDRIAKHTGCVFMPDVRQESEWQVDGILWSPDRRLALIEVSVGALRDAESAGGDDYLLKQGLHRIFVESSNKRGAPKSEGVQQLGRDVALLSEGKLQPFGIPDPVRVHPLLVVYERHVQTPGVWYYLDDEFTNSLPTNPAWPVAPLAVLTIEELESIEALAEAGKLRGNPPGILKLLRMWEASSRKKEAWWAFMERDFSNPPDNQRLRSLSDEWVKG